MAEECKLCGGSGEVTITPDGAPDVDADIYDCPACMERERAELEAHHRKDVRILADANRRYADRIAELERQQGVLVEALSGAIDSLEDVAHNFPGLPGGGVRCASIVGGRAALAQAQKSGTEAEMAASAPAVDQQKGGE